MLAYCASSRTAVGNSLSNNPPYESFNYVVVGVLLLSQLHATDAPHILLLHIILLRSFCLSIKVRRIRQQLCLCKLPGLTFSKMRCRKKPSPRPLRQVYHPQALLQLLLHLLQALLCHLLLTQEGSHYRETLANLKSRQ